MYTSNGQMNFAMSYNKASDDILNKDQFLKFLHQKIFYIRLNTEWSLYIHDNIQFFYHVINIIVILLRIIISI